ncbi:MAG: PCMD domain-containing protein [Bacteroidales bacterium]|nr:PCMD domain-containing protein [Bacteroidales bacterium]
MNKKNRFIFILIFLFAAGGHAIAQDTIPNPSFETWTNGQPEHWDSSNKSIYGVQFEGVTEDSISPQHGNSAAMLESTTEAILTFPVTLPGLLTLGEIIIDVAAQTGYITGGIPFTGRPDELKGYYKSSPKPGDSCFIGILMTKWNINTRDTLAYGWFYTSSKVQNWTEFKIDLDYLLLDNPDSMNIIVSSSDVLNEIIIHGSTLWIDNFTLDYGGASIFDINMNKHFSVYPDETGKNLIISLNFDKAKQTSISLYSINGQELFHIEKSIEQYCETVNISSLPPGIYIVNVNTVDGNRFTQKVSIN